MASMPDFFGMSKITLNKRRTYRRRIRQDRWRAAGAALEFWFESDLGTRHHDGTIIAYLRLAKLE